MKNAIIYTRFSPRPNAKDCDSCEGQRERCQKYCSLKGYFSHDVFSDRGVSGKAIDRPELTKALLSLQPGMVLVVDRNDRLARDMLVALTIHKTVEEKGCTIEFADGSPMRTTPEGKLFQNILSAFANFEREKFAERTKKGMQKKKDNGTHCGRPPYGWKIEPAAKVLIKDADEQVRIQSIRAQYQLGFSSDYVAALFNDSHLTCRGKPWSARTIRQIISRNSP